MASVAIPEQRATNMTGENTIVTGECNRTGRKGAMTRYCRCHEGGASGIGLATAKILASDGVKVYILDIATPDEARIESNTDLTFWSCDVTSWAELRKSLQAVGQVDVVFANAGVSERNNYFADSLDDDGNLTKPPSTPVGFSLTGVFYVIILSSGGSIVVTTSATAYVPWQSLAVYTSAKVAVRERWTQAMPLIAQKLIPEPR